MKKQKDQVQSQYRPSERFEIKNPRWTFIVCLLSTIVFFVIFLVCCVFMVKNNDISPGTVGVSCLFLAAFAVSAVGVYVCAFEKLTYRDGVYNYHRPFGKNQLAKTEALKAVKFLTIYFRTKHGINKKIRIFFYDKNKNILIKINDDGTVSNNELLLKSLKYHRIKIIREEKHDY